MFKILSIVRMIHLLFLNWKANLLFLFFLTSANSQNIFFSKTKIKSEVNATKNDSNANAYQFDYSKLSSALAITGITNKKKINTIVVGFPDKNGNSIDFMISERAIMDEEQQKKYPEIRSYFGHSTKNPSIKISFSLSPYKGLSGIMINNGEFVVYEPLGNIEVFKVLEKKNIKSLPTINCLAPINLSKLNDQESYKKKEETTLKKKYTIAISVTSDYSAFHGNTLASVNAAIVATLTNVNAVFENDLNISLQLVSNNDSVLFLDSDNDPYLDSYDYGESLQNILDSKIGNSNYSIGHLFIKGGVSGNSNCIGCVCQSGLKGRAYSSSNYPTGYFFDYNLVAHEIGHQFGANHTWSHNGNEGTIAQVEPGSGSTIMGYSGIAGSANIELNNDPYFHGISIEQIKEFLKQTLCGEYVSTANTKPEVTVTSNITLPISTPFKLVGSAKDKEGDNLTYCWEQINNSNGLYPFPNPDVRSIRSILCRSFIPTTNGTRYIPNLTDLRYGLNKSQWEKVPNVNRKANFRLTVRDNNREGLTDFGDVEINFDANYGPFKFNSFNTKDLFLLSNSNQSISWQVNRTNELPGGSTLKLSLSTNGGLSYNYILANDIPNNGNFQFRLPNISAQKCRFMLEANGGDFFTINDEDFAIGQKMETNCEKFVASINLPQSISSDVDQLSFSNSIFIDEEKTFDSLKIGVNLSHELIGNLEIALESPKGTKVILKNTGSCSDENSIIGTFQDQALSFDCSKTPNNFVFKPQGDSLDIFKGESTFGLWNIILKNAFPSLEGVLNTWSIEFCSIKTLEIKPTKDFELISIYPNPNRGSFIVTAPKSHPLTNLTLELFDVNGKLLYSKQILETEYLNEIIALANPQSGLYFLKITTKNEELLQKIIIY